MSYRSPTHRPSFSFFSLMTAISFLAFSLTTASTAGAQGQPETPDAGAEETGSEEGQSSESTDADATPSADEAAPAQETTEEAAPAAETSDVAAPAAETAESAAPAEEAISSEATADVAEKPLAEEAIVAEEAVSSEDVATDGADESAEATRAEPRRTGPMPTKEYISKVNLIAERPSMGYGAVGLWGQGVANDIRFIFPFGPQRNLAVRTRVVWNWGKLDLYGDSPFDPNVAVHVELALRSPVLMGVVRFYVAPAIFVGFRPLPIDDNPKTELDEGAHFSFAGGGYYGVEVFTSPYSTFFIEVGGQGPAHKLAVDSGFNLMVGKHFALGRKLPEDRRKKRIGPRTPRIPRSR